MWVSPTSHLKFLAPGSSGSLLPRLSSHLSLQTLLRDSPGAISPVIPRVLPVTFAIPSTCDPCGFRVLQCGDRGCRTQLPAQGCGRVFTFSLTAFGPCSDERRSRWTGHPWDMEKLSPAELTTFSLRQAMCRQSIPVFALHGHLNLTFSSRCQVSPEAFVRIC